MLNNYPRRSQKSCLLRPVRSSRSRRPRWKSLWSTPHAQSGCPRLRLLLYRRSTVAEGRPVSRKSSTREGRASYHLHHPSRITDEHPIQNQSGNRARGQPFSREAARSPEGRMIPLLPLRSSHSRTHLENRCVTSLCQHISWTPRRTCPSLGASLARLHVLKASSEKTCRSYRFRLQTPGCPRRTWQARHLLQRHDGPVDHSPLTSLAAAQQNSKCRRAIPP